MSVREKDILIGFLRPDRTVGGQTAREPTRVRVDLPCQSLQTILKVGWEGYGFTSALTAPQLDNLGRA